MRVEPAEGIADQHPPNGHDRHSAVVPNRACVFITGRRQAKLDKAVALIGECVEPVQGDATSAADLDRLYRTVMASKGKLDILVANSGFSEAATLDDTTEGHLTRPSASTRGRPCSPPRRPCR